MSKTILAKENDAEGLGYEFSVYAKPEYEVHDHDGIDGVFENKHPPYTVAIYEDGKTLIDGLTVQAAIALKNALSRAISKLPAYSKRFKQ